MLKKVLRASCEQSKSHETQRGMKLENYNADAHEARHKRADSVTAGDAACKPCCMAAQSVRADRTQVNVSAD